MTTVFSSQDDYIKFMTNLSNVSGEIFCSTFLPAVLFPKDAIETYFSKVEVISAQKTATKDVINYSRRVKKAVMEGTATLCIEVTCLQELCRTGIIHEASPRFTATYPTRIAVLKALKEMNESGTVYVTPEVIPFVFRLRPSSGVLIDVQRNVSTQLVQGIWIDDVDPYKRFEEEAKRLIHSASEFGTGRVLRNTIDSALSRLESGERFEWPK